MVCNYHHPPLTEERCRDSKQAKVEAEDAKIGIRNSRKKMPIQISKKIRKKRMNFRRCRKRQKMKFKR
jgi:ribosome recycling factor